MSRRRSENPTPEALRMRTYRERKACGVKCYMLEVDRYQVEKKYGQFDSDDEFIRFMNELIDDAIMNL